MLKKIRSAISTVFSLDLRSLALFRLLLATILIYDLLDRMKDLTAHYTDFGILPRDLAISSLNMPLELSIHFFSGHHIGITALFLVHILTAISLWIGFHTRLATIACWFLTVSLQNRNLILLHSGDSLLRLLLLWSIFLPLGAKYSLDEAMSSSSPQSDRNKHTSIASFAFIMQILFMYINTAYQKSDPMWTSNFQALYYALSGDQLISDFGKLLLPYKTLLERLTASTIVLEYAGPLLIIVPWKNSLFKTVTSIVFIFFHVGIALAMNIGIFPFVCIAAWIALLPDSFWTKLNHIFKPTNSTITVYYDGSCLFCHKMVRILRCLLLRPDISLQTIDSHLNINQLSKQENSWVVEIDQKLFVKSEALFNLIFQSRLWIFPKFSLNKKILLISDKAYSSIANNRRKLSFITSMIRERQPPAPKLGFIATALVGILFSIATAANMKSMNLYTKDLPQEVIDVGDIFSLGQNWGMFAPFPILVTGWYVMEGHLEDGSSVDAWTQKPISWDKPTNVAENYGGDRWKSYLMTLYTERADSYRLGLGAYLCNKWNQSQSSTKQMKEIQIYFMAEELQRSYKPRLAAEKWLISDWRCERPASQHDSFSSL